MINNIIKEDLINISKSSYIDWNQLNNRTVFITGATGFIGSWLLRSLSFVAYGKQLNIRIIAYARDEEALKSLISECSEYTDGIINIEYIIGDICKEITCKQDIDYVIHCASPTSSKYFIEKPLETINSIVLGTTNIIDFAYKKKVKKTVYLSTLEIYGQPHYSENDVQEDNLGYINILSPRSSYSEGKRMAECLCASAVSQLNMDISIARLGQVVGPGIREKESRTFAQFARNVINGEDIVLHTKGLSEGNYIYVRDVITALFVILSKGKSGEAYNVANESCHTTTKNMAELLAKEVANDSIKVIYDIPKENVNYGYLPDIRRKLSQKKMCSLEWKPEVSLKDSYIRLIESLSEQ